LCCKVNAFDFWIERYFRQPLPFVLLLGAKDVATMPIYI